MAPKNTKPNGTHSPKSSDSHAPRHDAHEHISPKTGPQFHWEPHPRAQALINDLLNQFLAWCPEASALADRMKHDTGTRFLDWVDSIHVRDTAALRDRLAATGFSHRPIAGADNRYIHEGAIFPTIVLEAPRPPTGVNLGSAPRGWSDPAVTMKVAIKVDSVADYLAASNIPDDFPVEGEPLSIYRRALGYRTPPQGELGACELWAVERHGYRAFEIPKFDPAFAILTLRHYEALRCRDRDFAHTDDQGFDHVHALVEAAVKDLGKDLACDLFFFSEREYWQRRNRAAQVQKARQDRLGLGWANHDHHTYRCSREHFVRTIALLEKLGFHLRERFYAGHEAGWGAQVLEQPICGITIFADVDLSAEELEGDFAHTPLPPREGGTLGTVGLWCGLHGEAMLQAGMHHLECQFDHDALKDQLRSAAIGTMAPFTNFPFLRQAFTEGERWPISEVRLMRLVQSARLTPQEAHRFRMEGGALGSHLENLERNDGYKGFNQQGVSDIIARTDPRKMMQAALSGQHALTGA